MTVQSESKSPSRRALLAGALGGIGAWAASAIGRAGLVRAEGENIQIGEEYATAASVTKLTNTANDTDVFWAQSNGAGVGVVGSSSSSVGVLGGSSSNVGVFGNSFSTTQAATVGRSTGNSTGLQGFSTSGVSALPAAKAKTGVYGYANQDSSAKGVFGESAKGYAGYFVGKVYTTKFHEMKEVSTPAAPDANKGRLFMRDNGAGKTQLCVRFNTGGVLVIKTQP